MDKDQTSSKELLFLQTISMFQAAAMQQLGKTVDVLALHVDQGSGRMGTQRDIVFFRQDDGDDLARAFHGQRIVKPGLACAGYLCEIPGSESI